VSLVCVASARSSPGATTTALALTATWPQDGRRVAIVEADPDGGVLAARYGLGWEPGLTTVAAAGRRGLANSQALLEHAQPCASGFPVIVGPGSAEQASLLLRTAGVGLGRAFAELRDAVVIADCGRIGPSSPSLELTREADLLLVVCRPHVEELPAAADRLRALSSIVDNVALVLVGERPHDAREVQDVLDHPIAGVVADDARGAGALVRGATSRSLRRSPLLRTARELAERVATRVPAAAGTPAAPPVAAEGPDGHRDRERAGFVARTEGEVGP